jgi:CP family cyanate transporter-like MFS transporter
VRRTSSRAALIALLFAGLTFRPQIVGVGPLFPLIQDDLDVSHAVIGLLGTIPVLCMGLLAPPAALVARRLGTRAGIGLAIVVVGMFGLGRSVIPGIALVVLLTWGIGVGMGVGGAMVPVAVKERFPQRSGFATGVYGTGIQAGSALSSAAAVPLAHGLDGWRSSLVVFSAVTCLLGAGWFVLLRGEPAHAPPDERPPMLPWGRPIAWLLVLIFGLMSATYYGLTNWLADSYVERGWSDSRAGWMFAVFNLASIPGALLIPWLSDHIGSRRPWLVLTATLYLIGAFGFVQVPALVWLWAVVGGVASGAMFALVLTLPLDLERDPRRVGALVGMMLGLGYVIGAASPLLLGVVRDATGSFTGSLWAIVACSALLLGTVACTPRTGRSGRAATTS